MTLSADDLRATKVRIDGELGKQEFVQFHLDQARAMVDLALRTVEAETERDAADQLLVDKYREPKTGYFNFPSDVAKIVTRLETAAAVPTMPVSSVPHSPWANCAVLVPSFNPLVRNENRPRHPLVDRLHRLHALDLDRRVDPIKDLLFSRSAVNLTKLAMRLSNVGRGSAPGERRGGRKLGVPNKATKAIRAKAAKTGLMPVDILLDIARYHHDRAKVARQKKPAKLPGTALVDPKSVVDIENEIRTEHAMAANAADKVAPYYHPKLATLQSNVNLTGRLTLEQLVEASLPLPANSNGAVPPAVEGKDAGAV